MNPLIKTIFRKPYYLFKEIKLYFKKPVYNSKVFCIGYNKTGTTTLGKSLEQLGLNNSSFNKKVWRKYYANKQFDKILKYTAKFDSTDDLPWLKTDMIPLLDQTFPNSKFIYLTRDEESWKNSLMKWTFKVKGFYPNIEEELILFREHKAFVLDYFKNRPKDQFIILDIKDQKGFKKLAHFIGRTPIQDHFPHFNKSS